MVTQQAEEDVILFSIKPMYAAAILSGDKSVEFRRKVPARDISMAVIYATSPVSAVVGYCRVAGIVKASPSSIWKRFGEVGGIRRASYRSYFEGSEVAVAIELTQPKELPVSVKLRKIRRDLRAPRSYNYLTPAEYQRMLERANA